MDSRWSVALIIVGVLAAWGVWYLVRSLLASKALPGSVARAGTVDAEHQLNDQSGAKDAQAVASPPAALVKQWAHGRQCVACGGALVESRMTGHHLALLEPSGMTREWVDVAADRLPLALATSLPMCWNCHIAATFRRLHPELVTDRDDDKVHVRHS